MVFSLSKRYGGAKKERASRVNETREGPRAGRARQSGLTIQSCTEKGKSPASLP